MNCSMTSLLKLLCLCGHTGAAAVYLFGVITFEDGTCRLHGYIASMSEALDSAEEICPILLFRLVRIL